MELTFQLKSEIIRPDKQARSNMYCLEEIYFKYRKVKEKKNIYQSNNNHKKSWCKGVPPEIRRDT